LKNPSQKRTNNYPGGSAKSRIWGAETLKPIAKKFCTPGAVHDVITHADIGEDWLRGFGLAMGRILAICIDVLRRL